MPSVTKTLVYNMAAALMGQGRVAAADSDTSNHSLWMDKLWATSLEEALRRHPWNFAAWRMNLAENLLLQSEDFATSWTATNATATANQTQAPDGQTTADLLTDADASNAGTIAQAVTVPNNSDTHTFAVFLKQGTAAASAIRIGFSVGTGVTSTVTVTWGTTPTVDAGALSDAGNGWWRVAVSLANNGTGNTTCTCTVYPAGTTASAQGTVYAWGAQLARRTSAPGYSPTTTAARRLIKPAHGYTWGHLLPTDFLRLYDQNDGDTRYKIEGGYLLHDDDSVPIRYIRTRTDATTFDPLFARALAAQLAKDVNPAITGNGARDEIIARAWKDAFSVGARVDGQEDGWDPEPDPVWIQARYAG